MNTLSVDDRRLVVESVKRILYKIDPEGNHRVSTDPQEALRMLKRTPAEIAFLDWEMPELPGPELAEEMRKINPKINIIFITGHEEYAVQAFRLSASDYLLKPVTEQAVVNALSHLRYPLEQSKEQKLKVTCFGNFEVFFNGVPVRFSRSKSKELFAYLIDRCGAVCTTDMVLGNLWPDELPTASLKSLYRTLVVDVAKSLNDLGIGEALIRDRGGVCVNMNMIDCDYYRYLDGDAGMRERFQGEYMSQYEFAEETRATLQQKMGYYGE